MVMKYIIFQSDAPIFRLLPIIFPKYLVHADVAKYFEHLLRRSGIDNAKLYSAGECNLFGGKVTCSGRSETLNINSQPDDDIVISTYNYTGGIV